jgi:hypothetical protein
MSQGIGLGCQARLRRAVLAGLLVLPAAAFAQQPTQAEIGAVRGACQSDYRAHCAGVPPGGSASLACLKENAASLSPACLNAVNAIGGAAKPVAEKPAPAAKTAPGEPPAAMSSPPATSSPASSPPAPASPPPAAKVPASAAPAPQARSYPPMEPREEFVILRRACGRDVRMLCGEVPPGGGRVIACLRGNSASLSGRCKAAIMGAMER